MKKINSVILLGISTLLLSACETPASQEPMSTNNFIISTVLWFLMGLGVFWILVLKPQQIEAQKKEEALKSLKKGSKVITNSGIFGTVVDVNKDVIIVEIAKGVNVRMQPDVVQPVTVQAVAAAPANKK